ncbi:MAG: alpha,2-mannosyltransferase [Actinomycetota bacterium]|nr:alpha,2-mannosyltransferase [Actinomycetota bacterium]
MRSPRERLRLSPRSRGGALVLVAIGVFVVQFVLAARVPSAERFADLQVYRGAVDSWLDGGTLYEYRRHNGDVFTYPPVAGHLLWWLRCLPVGAAEALWAALTFGAMGLLAHAFTAEPLGRTPGPDRTQAQGSTDTQGLTRARALSASVLARPGFAVLLLLLVCTSPGRSNLAFGQVSVFVVALAAHDILRHDHRWAGLPLGLAIAVKLTPALFVPMLWCAGRRRQAVTAAGAALALTGASWVLRPGESADYWGHHLADGSRFVNGSIPGNQSLRAFLDREHCPAAGVCWVVLCALVVAAALYAGSVLARRGDLVQATVVVGAASLVVSPISWTHHQFWLVPAVLLTVPGPRRRTHRWRAVVVGVLMLGPVRGPGPSAVSWIVTESHLLLALACLGLGLWAALDGRRTGPSFPAQATRFAVALRSARRATDTEAHRRVG